MIAVALCALVAGCGTARPPERGPGGAAPAAARRPAAAAGNRAAARAEARRLLSLARVPPGAVRLARPPRELSAPAMGTPAVTSLVDRVAAWRVRMPFPVARDWLAAHPPRGLRPDGSAASGYANTGVITMAGTSYRGPASGAWQSADLEIGVAPAGPAASVIRADAVIVWLDPRPIRSGPGARPVRVTVASGCPASDRGVTGVISPGPGLSRRMLPPGRPVAGLRCRYDGLNGHPWRLVGAARLSAAAARRAAMAMLRLPLSHPDGARVSCPLADGSAEVLALAYPGRPDVDLWVTIGGCGGVSNGHILAGRA